MARGDSRTSFVALWQDGNYITVDRDGERLLLLVALLPDLDLDWTSSGDFESLTNWVKTDRSPAEVDVLAAVLNKQGESTVEKRYVSRRIPATQLKQAVWSKYSTGLKDL